MTAPWHDQPTPLVDDKEKSFHSYLESFDCIDSHTARAIERRMRAAEALLADVTPSLVACGRHDLAKAINAHLAAAREMDGENTSLHQRETRP